MGIFSIGAPCTLRDHCVELTAVRCCVYKALMLGRCLDSCRPNARRTPFSSYSLVLS